MRHRALLILWLISDLVLFVVMYCIAYFARVGWILSTDFLFSNFLLSSVIVAPMWLIVLATTRTFALTRNQMHIRNGAYIGYSCVVGIALFTLAHYFLHEEFFSRALVGLAGIISFLGIWSWHIIFGLFLRRILRRDPPSFPTLIVGVTRESTALIRKLNRRNNALKPVAILDGRGAKEKEIDGVSVEGKLNKLEETIDRYKITHLIQCSDLENSLNLLSACRSRGITYMLLPSVLGIVEHDERIDSLEGQPVTIVSPKKSPLEWFVR